MSKKKFCIGCNILIRAFAFETVVIKPGVDFISKIKKITFIGFLPTIEEKIVNMKPASLLLVWHGESILTETFLFCAKPSGLFFLSRCYSFGEKIVDS